MKKVPKTLNPPQLIPNWNIATKIGLGYAAAISIAICGGIVGLSVGDYYQRRADQTLQLAETQANYLALLKNTVLEIRSHPQQLITVLDDPIWFDYETSEFINNIRRLDKISTDLEEYVAANSDSLAAPINDYLNLDRGYIETVEAYKNLIKDFSDSINPLNSNAQDILETQRNIITGITGATSIELNLQFERLSEDLLRIEQAVQKQKDAALVSQANASHLRLRIIIISFALAIAIAALLAIQTSRAIARPLVAVTQVAQKVTEESDFDIRAPITTRDEVGILAHALNRLIKRVGDYTHKLERSQETLEQRVQERTQELQDTLENLKSTQSQLIQTEKMSSLGQMVAGVAHEINNPVGFIHGNLIHLNDYVQDLFDFIDLLQQHVPPQTPAVEEMIEEIDFDFLQSDLPEVLQSMKMGSDRIKEIVLSLRNFSRLDEATMKDVDLHEGIENTLTILNNRLKQGVKVVKNYGDLPLVFCYPAQINQVFMNLIANALDAMEEAAIQDQTITITTTRLESDRVCLKIRDNGVGIPDKLKEKLFDPFFTTKPIGKGTGLGLSICYQIIEKHQGTIGVSSQAGIGTEFAIVLPIEADSIEGKLLSGESDSPDNS
ncbi:MAG: HAMP domain-containing protein [Spirulina sp. SIO3F2]|nr:HAMP domain-containing protein [Spirulina sp. SIO3F2]